LPRAQNVLIAFTANLRCVSKAMAYGRGISVSGRQRRDGRSWSCSPSMRCLMMTDIS